MKMTPEEFLRTVARVVPGASETLSSLMADRAVLVMIIEGARVALEGAHPDEPKDPPPG